MSQPQPFIEDPGHLARLEGQRYVVLRAASPVTEAWADVQHALRERLSGVPVSYPARAHVTLAGFRAGTELRAIQELVEEWIPSVAPLRLAVERVASFPAPFQIVIVQIQKTEELFAAMAGLRGLAATRRLPVSSLTSVEDWIFHMSVAYCPFVDSEIWSDVNALLDTLEVPTVDCVVDEVEVVAYDEGQERSVAFRC